MAKLRDTKERGYLPSLTMRRLLFIGYLTMGKLFLTNLKDIKKLGKIKPAEISYKRPEKRNRRIKQGR